METGFGIGPIANLAQLPDRVEACGRRQPTEPVLTNEPDPAQGLRYRYTGVENRNDFDDAELIMKLPDFSQVSSAFIRLRPALTSAYARVQGVSKFLGGFHSQGLYPHRSFKILHTFNDDVHGTPVADCKL
jgi:hypothetical protein